MSLGHTNTHGVALALNPPRKSLVRADLDDVSAEECTTVYAVTKQPYQDPRPIVAGEVRWRSERAMRA